MFLNSPWASSIRSGRGHSGCSRVRNPRRGSRGPQTEPPSADIRTGAARKICHLIVCSQPWWSRSPGRRVWNGGASRASSCWFYCWGSGGQPSERSFSSSCEPCECVCLSCVCVCVCQQRVTSPSGWLSWETHTRPTDSNWFGLLQR